MTAGVLQGGIPTTAPHRPERVWKETGMNWRIGLGPRLALFYMRIPVLDPLHASNFLKPAGETNQIEVRIGHSE